jgi:DNA-binding winged helix-turn-helix (wHTH) protein
VEAGGELVTKEQLLQSAWPGLVVEEANVYVTIAQLRKVPRDSRGRHGRKAGLSVCFPQ